MGQFLNGSFSRLFQWEIVLDCWTQFKLKNHKHEFFNLIDNKSDTSIHPTPHPKRIKTPECGNAIFLEIFCPFKILKLLQMKCTW